MNNEYDFDHIYVHEHSKHLLIPLCISPCKGENFNPLLTKEGPGEVTNKSSSIFISPLIVVGMEQV